MPIQKGHQQQSRYSSAVASDIDIEDASQASVQQQYEEDQEESSSHDEHQDSSSVAEENSLEDSDQEVDSVQDEMESLYSSIVERRNRKQLRKAAKFSYQRSSKTIMELQQKNIAVNAAKQILCNASVKMSAIKQSLTFSSKGVDELNCSICMDYIINCRTAICGHSFCEICISESLIHRKECPNCRKDIRKWVLQKSKIVDSAVRLMIRTTSVDEAVEDSQAKLKRYQERLENHRVWLEKQEINPNDLKPGDKVDALDTEYIWCKAQVELKIRSRNHKPLLYLHYDGWSRKYDEYVYIDSRRVAPVGHYSNRQDIPRYHNSGGGQGGRGMPMNYAQVIESARSIQDALDLQVENDAAEDDEDPVFEENGQVAQAAGQNEQENDEQEGEAQQQNQQQNNDDNEPEQEQEVPLVDNRGASRGIHNTHQNLPTAETSSLQRAQEGWVDANQQHATRINSRLARARGEPPIRNIIASPSPFFRVSSIGSQVRLRRGETSPPSINISSLSGDYNSGRYNQLANRYRSNRSRARLGASLSSRFIRDDNTSSSHIASNEISRGPALEYIECFFDRPQQQAHSQRSQHQNVSESANNLNNARAPLQNLSTTIYEPIRSISRGEITNSTRQACHSCSGNPTTASTVNVENGAAVTSTTVGMVSQDQQQPFQQHQQQPGEIEQQLQQLFRAAASTAEDQQINDISNISNTPAEAVINLGTTGLAPNAEQCLENVNESQELQQENNQAAEAFLSGGPANVHCCDQTQLIVDQSDSLPAILDISAIQPSVAAVALVDTEELPVQNAEPQAQQQSQSPSTMAAINTNSSSAVVASSATDQELITVGDSSSTTQRQSQLQQQSPERNSVNNQDDKGKQEDGTGTNEKQ